MITLYKYEDLGHADHGWLDASHHFSFASYHNPERHKFGVLRVINDDKVAAGTGFATHPHENMEIITYVRQGAITHKDSMGNVGRTEAGDVQVMSAGTGVFHSEYNLESEDTKLYQIWIYPNKKGVKPGWDAKKFPKNFANGSLPVLVSGQSEHEGLGALHIHQDAAIFGGKVKAGETVTQLIKHQAYVLASKGEFKIGDVALKQGDGAEVTNLSQLEISALTDSELLVIDVPDSNITTN